MEQPWKYFDTKFGPQWKDQKSIYQVRQNVALFCNLVALILGSNCVKVLIVNKCVQKIKFQRAWSKLEEKLSLQRQSCTKYFRKTLVFIWNSSLLETFNVYSSAVSGYYQQSFYFGSKTGY